MLGFLRLMLFWAVASAAIYWLLLIYSRSLRREALEKEWDRRHPDLAGATPQRREFVRRSMVGFGKTLRARLVTLVLILPTVAIIAIIIIVNYN